MIFMAFAIDVVFRSASIFQELLFSGLYRHLVYLAPPHCQICILCTLGS